MIVQLDGAWPPILIDRATHRIIDGHYRFLAAKQAGRTHIECEYFDGVAEESFLEAVRRNATHGLPLTLAERRGVASRLLAAHDDWSDRRIATIAGLAPSTVAVVRRATATGTGATPTRRVGRDGTARLVDRRVVRERVRSALAAMPHGSLREVARVAGASPETVRAVRNEPCSPPAPVPAPLRRVREGHLAPDVAADPALTATSFGRAFTVWFGQSAIDREHFRFAHDVPLSRVYQLADEARRRAALWVAFADELEARTRASRG
jgi:hypothetical protein